MVSKELRKLNRRELIDIIYQMKKNEQQMQEQIAALQAELEEKRLRLSQTGSIAEAALAVTNIFSEAQEAANLYLQEISAMKAETERECQEILEQIAALQAELEEKRLRLSQAGSIAEAALAVTNVFSAAQEAADLYLQEISSMKVETERECKKILEQARKAAANPHPEESPRVAAAEPARQADRSLLRKVGQMIRRWTKIRK